MDPVNAYGRAKLMGERRAFEEGHEVLVVRTSWVFGMGGVNFVDTILKRVEGGARDLSVVNDQVARPDVRRPTSRRASGGSSRSASRASSTSRTRERPRGSSSRRRRSRARADRRRREPGPDVGVPEAGAAPALVGPRHVALRAPHRQRAAFLARGPRRLPRRPPRRRARAPRSMTLTRAEAARKALHIGMAGFALLLPSLPWGAALAAAGLACSLQCCPLAAGHAVFS